MPMAHPHVSRVYQRYTLDPTYRIPFDWLAFHFVYQIKKALGYTTNDVYVSIDALEHRKSLTALGEHLT